MTDAELTTTVASARREVRKTPSLPRLHAVGMRESKHRALRVQVPTMVATLLPKGSLESAADFRKAVQLSPALQDAIWPESWAGLRALTLLVESVRTSQRSELQNYSQ